MKIEPTTPANFPWERKKGQPSSTKPESEKPPEKETEKDKTVGVKLDVWA